eukprot:gene55699-76336_t
MLLKLQRKTPQKTELERLAAGMELPPWPDDLTAAEESFASLQAAKRDADEYLKFLQENYSRIGLTRADGSTIPTGDMRALGEAHRECERLAASLDAARRNLHEQRRSFELMAEQHVGAGASALADAVLDRLDEIDTLISVATDVTAVAAARNIRLRITALGRGVNEVSQTARTMRATLRRL